MDQYLCVDINGSEGIVFLGGSVPLCDYEWAWRYGVLIT